MEETPALCAGATIRYARRRGMSANILETVKESNGHASGGGVQARDIE
jgi:hypothetical protein